MEIYIIPILLLAIISFSLYFIYNSFTLESNNRLKRYVGRSFFDLIGIIPLIALFLGIIILLLKGISLLMNFTINFEKYYIILIASIFIYIMSRVIANIFTNITSVFLANRYLKEGLDEKEMKKNIKENKSTIRTIKVFLIFCMVLISYMFVGNTIGLNYNRVFSVIFAIINTATYTIIFKLRK